MGFKKSMRGPKALKSRPAAKPFGRKSMRDNVFDKPKKVGGFKGRKSFDSKPSRFEGRKSFDAKPSRFDRDASPTRHTAHSRGASSRDEAPRRSFSDRAPRFGREGANTERGPRAAHPAARSARPFGRNAHAGRSAAPRGGGRSGGGGRGRGFKKDFIDENRYINKAVNKDVDQYIPKHVFNDFGIQPKLAANLAAKGFEKPSPIQDQAIPVALTGKDIIGIAATGTGKTAAFLIPLINKIVADPKKKILVLAPTRELAQQVEEAFREFTRGMNLFSVTCVGGAPIYRQIRELRAGVHAVIGTPGRVKDLMLQGKINMKQYSSVVLDEADRMLDMGFIDDMKFILGEMPEERQSLFFSATFSDEIKHLCQRFLNNPTTIAIKSRDTASSVEQNVVRVRDDNDKIMQLEQILKGPHAQKVLIFREMKRHVDGLAETLNKGGFKVLALHGDMRNRERERAVQALSSGTVQAVIATDVAARGIDIKDITLVINYDLPNDYDTYVHRIGRTGRADKSGHALTFIPEKKLYR